mmetsp:Transcript_42162/g.134821  ORF Transcript_42162/g.134821 Transcript_42162/m.134821 type:complete len:392 (+) Transcript_42162:137-1312(+)
MNAGARLASTRAPRRLPLPLLACACLAFAAAGATSLHLPSILQSRSGETKPTKRTSAASRAPRFVSTQTIPSRAAWAVSPRPGPGAGAIDGRSFSKPPGRAGGPMVSSRLIWKGPTEPSSHAATIVEVGHGEMLASWFAGDEENAPNVGIYTSRWKSISGWDRFPREVVPPYTRQRGLCGGTTDIKCKRMNSTWNPVLAAMPDGEVLLFYKIGPHPSEWQGRLKRSRDKGQKCRERSSQNREFNGLPTPNLLGFRPSILRFQSNPLGFPPLSATRPRPLPRGESGASSAWGHRTVEEQAPDNQRPHPLPDLHGVHQGSQEEVAVLGGGVSGCRPHVERARSGPIRRQYHPTEPLPRPLQAGPDGGAECDGLFSAGPARGGGGGGPSGPDTR